MSDLSADMCSQVKHSDEKALIFEQAVYIRVYCTTRPQVASFLFDYDHCIYNAPKSQHRL